MEAVLADDCGAAGYRRGDYNFYKLGQHAITEAPPVSGTESSSDASGTESSSDASGGNAGKKSGSGGQRVLIVLLIIALVLVVAAAVFYRRRAARKEALAMSGLTDRQIRAQASQMGNGDDPRQFQNPMYSVNPEGHYEAAPGAGELRPRIGTRVVSGGLSSQQGSTEQLLLSPGSSYSQSSLYEVLPVEGGASGMGGVGGYASIAASPNTSPTPIAGRAGDDADQSEA
jgi:type II secretory pathway pseudopilin PulG